MKYKEVILGTMMVGAILSPVSAKAKMPTAMKIYTLQTLLSDDKKTQKAQKSKPEEPVKTEQAPQPVKKYPMDPKSEEGKKVGQRFVLGVLGTSIILLACCGAYDWYADRYRKARGKER